MPKKYFVIIGILILLSPLGLISEGSAWGEWASTELNEMIGFVPAGLASASQWQQAIFPDYSIPFLGEGKYGETVGYIIAAIIGSVVVYGLTLLLMRLMLSRSGKRKNYPA